MSNIKKIEEKHKFNLFAIVDCDFEFSSIEMEGLT
jgi:hypothetical protein